MKILFLMMLPDIVLASEAGINWWHLGSAYQDAPALGWVIITFLIFVYGMAKVIKQPLTLYLEMRSKTIKEQIEEGIKAKEEGQKQLKEYEEKLKSLDQEIESMRERVLNQAEAEKKERELLFLDMKNRIITEAEDTIKADFLRYKNHLAKEVIDKAFTEALDMIQTQQGEVDSALKSRFLQDLAQTKEV